MKTKTRSLTLLEIFIALTCLALIGSVLIYKGNGMVKKYRFDHDISTLQTELKLTRRLAVSHGIDLEYTFDFYRGVLTYERHSDDPTLKKIPDFLRQKKIKGLTNVLFNESEINEEKKINISKTGWMVPGVLLTIESPYGKVQLNLDEGIVTKT